nr:DNA ligase 1-like [Aegilops tauschii subsp. strangulata]
MDYPEMAKMDFCEVIIECIKEGAKIWQNHRNLPQEEKNKKHVNGLAQGPVIMYLDSLLLPTDKKEVRKIAKTMDKTSLPRANHLKESDLAKIARADMKRDGKARPYDYEFGKIQERTNSTPGQDELQQQDGVNNPKNTNERNKQSNFTTDNATTTTTPTQAQHMIDVGTCEEAQLKNNQVSSPANQMQEANPQSTVSQALQDQETTRVEIEPHSAPQTDEGVTEQELCVQDISSATTLQITITSTKEKAQDIPADEKQETVIPDKETVDAGTNNPVINTNETNEYTDLEDQELQTTTSKEEEEASKSTSIDIQQEKQEDNTRQGEAVVPAVDSPATPEIELQEKKVSDDEKQNKEQEKDPKPPLNEESAVTTTNTEREETNEQKEDTEEGQHVLQKAVINVTEDQAPKYSLTEKHAAETAAATTTEKLQDKDDGSGDELQKKEEEEEEDAQKPPLNEEQAQHSAAATRTVGETTEAATIEEKHEEGDHGDTSNEAGTHIVPEKEAETIEENPTPSYDANSPGREVSANQVETEKKTEKTTSKTRRLTRKNMMLRKTQTTQMRMEQKLNKRVQCKKKNITCHKKQKENKKGTTLDRTYLLAPKQARQ